MTRRAYLYQIDPARPRRRTVSGQLHSLNGLNTYHLLTDPKRRV